VETELLADVQLLTGILDDTVRERRGEEALELVRRIRGAAESLRKGTLPGGREAFASEFPRFSLEQLGFLARTFTAHFLLLNAAEEQHRIRTLRSRDDPASPPHGSIAAACRELKQQGVGAQQVRALLERMLVMPVLTAHPSEARRGTVLDHLEALASELDHLDDPRRRGREREEVLQSLRATVLALDSSDETRPYRPSPLDEVTAGLHVFQRTLMDATPRIYRDLEDALCATWPGEEFRVGPFLRWGTWIGGDRDGNPNVTSDVTRAAFERQRQAAISRLARDTLDLGRELSVAARLAGGTPEALARSLEEDRERLPEVAARVRRKEGFEPWREKLSFMRARLELALAHAEDAYSSSAEYLEDLRLLESTLGQVGLSRLASGRLRDAIRRAQIFGFHLATVDIRQHSGLHEAAVADVLRHGGGGDYSKMGEAERVQKLAALLERADVGCPADRECLAEGTRELLETMDVVGRARRDLGPESCGRWVISFCHDASDVLEVLFLARAARLAPDEVRPVPLYEQIEDLEAAESRVDGLLKIAPFRAALRGELEVMVGYSDSSKQAGYVASAVALRAAQKGLARAADRGGVMLTVFHGRGGAVGRGGGPAIRAIRAQPRDALRGRFRVTEQGETVATRYGRADIAHRDLEQTVYAVLLRSLLDEAPTEPSERDRRQHLLDKGAAAARHTYDRLVADRERLTAYVTQSTPIEEIAQLRLASRPASRKSRLSFEDLRAIPWVFSWNQSRHGVPGWFGLGSALEAIAKEGGPEAPRRMYARSPYFQALVDNAQLALARADIEVAAQYAKLAGPNERGLFELIRDEHHKTVQRVLDATAEPELMAAWPTIARTVTRRNPYVDVLSHAQIELLRRLRAAQGAEDQERIRAALFVTINGIAAGLQTAG